MSEVFDSSLDLLMNNQAGGHKQLKEELIGMRSTLKQAMDKGLSKPDMDVAMALSAAVDAADEAVEKIYTKLFG